MWGGVLAATAAMFLSGVPTGPNLGEGIRPNYYLSRVHWVGIEAPVAANHDVHIESGFVQRCGIESVSICNASRESWIKRWWPKGNGTAFDYFITSKAAIDTFFSTDVGKHRFGFIICCTTSDIPNIAYLFDDISTYAKPAKYPNVNGWGIANISYLDQHSPITPIRPIYRGFIKSNSYDFDPRPLTSDKFFLREVKCRKSNSVLVTPCFGQSYSKISNESRSNGSNNWARVSDELNDVEDQPERDGVGVAIIAIFIAVWFAHRSVRRYQSGLKTDDDDRNRRKDGLDRELD